MKLNQVPKQTQNIGVYFGPIRQAELELPAASDQPQDRYYPSTDDRAFGVTMVGLAAFPVIGGFVLGQAAGVAGSNGGGGKLAAMLGIGAISNLIGSGILMGSSLGTSLNTAGLALLGLPAAAMATMVYQKLHHSDGPGKS